MVKVGVIGLQGDVEEHIWAARRALKTSASLEMLSG